MTLIYPRTDKVIVEPNDNRLRSTCKLITQAMVVQLFMILQMMLMLQPCYFNKIDTKVFVDGVETTAYTITQGSDSTTKAISLDSGNSQKQKLILLFYKMPTTVLTVLQK